MYASVYVVRVHARAHVCLCLAVSVSFSLGVGALDRDSVRIFPSTMVAHPSRGIWRYPQLESHTGQSSTVSLCQGLVRHFLPPPTGPLLAGGRYCLSVSFTGLLDCPTFLWRLPCLGLLFTSALTRTSISYSVTNHSVVTLSPQPSSNQAHQPQKRMPKEFSQPSVPKSSFSSNLRAWCVADVHAPGISISRSGWT